MKPYVLLAGCLAAVMAPQLAICTEGPPQALNVTSPLQIPGAVLSPGAYEFTVEDHLNDRVIVRVTSGNAAEHHLLVAVRASDSAGVDASGFGYYPAADGGRALRSWKPQIYPGTLEFVYSKAEAIALTASSGSPVVAADPAYYKLPTQNLSADDLKVVQLWLLQPERIEDRKGIGVKAEKYKDADVSAASAPQGTEVASAAAPPERTRLPKTASNTYLVLFCGIISLLGAVTIRLIRWQRT